MMCFCAGNRRAWVAWGILVAGAMTAVAEPALADRPSVPSLLPDTTVVLLWSPGVPELTSGFMNSSLGRMGQDPQLKPLIDEMYGALAQRVEGVHDRIGLSLAQLLAVPQGELALAAIAAGDGPPELVALMDAGDRASDARTLFEHAKKALDQSGARKSVQTLSGTKCLVYEDVGRRSRHLVFLERDATFVVGSSVESVQAILNAWNGDQAGTLAKQAKFTTIMKRSGSEELKPQLVWYVDPINLMRAVGNDNPGVRLAVAMLPVLGLDGVKALGGSVTFDAGQFDSIFYAHALLDGMRDGVVEMIALRPGETEPEPWVPADVAGYTTLGWHFPTTFKELTNLYDGFRGEGALARLLEQRIERRTGIHVEHDLLPYATGRVIHLTRIERPVTPRAQATLVAFQLSDEGPVRDALERVHERNRDFLVRKSFGGQKYLQVEPPRLTDEPEDGARPRPCFGVMFGYLMLSNRTSLLEKVIATGEGKDESLSGAADYRRVTSKIRQGPTKPSMIGFVRPWEGMRLIYESALAEESRERMRRGGQRNPFLSTLNLALEKHALPPFEVIEQYLGPRGAVLVDDVSGLHYTGFTLRREEQ